MSKPCARIERWVLWLQGYDFKIVYQPGKTNIADALSHYLGPLDHGEKYYFVRGVVESQPPVALSQKEIEEVSYNDEELCLGKTCVRPGTGNGVRFLQMHMSQTNIMHPW